MRSVRILAMTAVVIMGVTVVTGFLSGDFFDEGGDIWSLAWGRVTLIDLYVGLGLFGGWVAIRELRWPSIVAWWLGLVVLGNLGAALYLVRSAFTSSSVRELLLGKRLAVGDPRDHQG
jgi:hypothetical protein